jgi:hypothetical protein
MQGKSRDIEEPELSRASNMTAMLRSCLPLACLCLACGGCLGRDLSRTLDHGFAMAQAATGFAQTHGRFPQSEGELFDGAEFGGVRIERSQFKRLCVRPTREGGVTIEWAGKDRGTFPREGLSGSVSLPRPPE